MPDVQGLPRSKARFELFSLPLLHPSPDVPTSSTPAATATLTPPLMFTILPMPKVCPSLSLPSAAHHPHSRLVQRLRLLQGLPFAPVSLSY